MGHLSPSSLRPWLQKQLPSRLLSSGLCLVHWLLLNHFNHRSYPELHSHLPDPSSPWKTRGDGSQIHTSRSFLTAECQSPISTNRGHPMQDPPQMEMHHIHPKLSSPNCPPKNCTSPMIPTSANGTSHTVEKHLNGSPPSLFLSLTPASKSCGSTGPVTGTGDVDPRKCT